MSESYISGDNPELEVIADASGALVMRGGVYFSQAALAAFAERLLRDAAEYARHDWRLVPIGPEVRDGRD